MRVRASPHQQVLLGHQPILTLAKHRQNQDYAIIGLILQDINWETEEFKTWYRESRVVPGVQRLLNLET